MARLRNSKGQYLSNDGTSKNTRKRNKGKKNLTDVIGKKQPEQITYVGLVQDVSGSMSGVIDEAFRALNGTIQSIASASKDNKQKTFGSVEYFGERLQFPVELAEIDKISTLYKPVTLEGYTRLYDAIGAMIEKFSVAYDSGNTNTAFILTVITDGLNNRTDKYFLDGINDLMREKLSTDRWSFVFLVPPGRKQEFVNRHPFLSEGNIREWEATVAGVREYAQVTTEGFKGYFVDRALGKTKTEKFFLEAGKLSKKQVAAKLDKVDDVRVFSVDKEAAIKEFVEAKTGKPYVPGTAFYQVSKPETVQSYKGILIRKKGERTFFGGDNAKKLLGFPQGDVRLKPGNLGDWDVFIGSNSVNRILVRGTQLAVRA